MPPPYAMTYKRSSFVVVRPSQSEAAVYLDNRLTQNHPILRGHLHTDLLYTQSGYDITNYLWSEVIAKKCQKCRLRRLRVEFLQNGLIEDYQILHTCR